MPGLLGADGVHPMKKWKGIFGQGFVKLVLNWGFQPDAYTSHSGQLGANTCNGCLEEYKGILDNPACEPVLSGAFTWFRCPYIEAHKIGNKQDELETCKTASVTSLAYQRHGGTVPMTGTLE